MAGKLAGRRKYVVVVCGLALIGGLGLMAARALGLQYGFSKRQQIIATAPDAFDAGTNWYDDFLSDNFERSNIKDRVMHSHPAYALGIATTMIPAAFKNDQPLCKNDSIIITAVMATCKLPTGYITANGSYLLNFANKPIGPTKFNAAGIPLWENGVPNLHPDGVSDGHYIGLKYTDTGPGFSKGADSIVYELTNKHLTDVPANGLWTPSISKLIDARNCYASRGRNIVSVMCFWEG